MSLLRCRGTTCELSAIELRDLRPGYDFVHDREFRLFSWDFADARCYVPPSGTPPPPSGVLPSTSKSALGINLQHTFSKAFELKERIHFSSCEIKMEKGEDARKFELEMSRGMCCGPIGSGVP